VLVHWATLSFTAGERPKSSALTIRTRSADALGVDFLVLGDELLDRR
jgi:hypothetical protein